MHTDLELVNATLAGDFGEHARQRVPKPWEELRIRRPEKLPSRVEKRIEKVVREYAKGLSKKDINRIMGCFSKEYSTDGMGYVDVRCRTSQFLNNAPAVQMKVKDVSTILNADCVSIVAVVEYSLERGAGVEMIGKLWLKFAREGEDWKIVSGNLL